MIHIKDRLSDYHDFLKKLVDDHQMVLASDVMDMIEQIKDDLEQDEKENGWIPVSERLPDDDSCVLVILKSIYPDNYWEYDIARNIELPDKSYWCSCHYGYLEHSRYSTKPYRVTCWRTLPEPYKED